METPSTIIYCYTKDRGYTYLNIPIRLVKECGITSGNRFLGFVRNGKLVIEQEKILEREVTDGPQLGTR